MGLLHELGHAAQDLDGILTCGDGIFGVLNDEAYVVAEYLGEPIRTYYLSAKEPVKTKGPLDVSEF